MAAKWVGAALKQMRAPWTGENSGEMPATPEPTALRAGVHRTPEGVASWLAFHGVEIRRPDAASAGSRHAR
jgi:hypothetical protein